jgi:hypothetical protein
MKILDPNAQPRVDAALAALAKQLSPSPGEQTYSSGGLKFSDFPHQVGSVAVGRFKRKVACFAVFQPIILYLASGPVTATRVTSAWRNPEIAEARGFLLPLYFDHILETRGVMVSAPGYTASGLACAERIAERMFAEKRFAYVLSGVGSEKVLERLGNMDGWRTALAAGCPVVFSVRTLVKE